jgi:predicted GIY-YIG superfamily endonuclease
MRAVYLIRSLSQPDQTYVGSTGDVGKRLAEHNARYSPHTSKFAPWELVVVVQFLDPRRANAFERYLKSGSGRAFANRHFW